MRFLIAVLVLLAVGLGLIYNYGGIKFGILTVTPVRMWNAQGEATYTYRISDNLSGVQVKGGCTSSRGNVILRLTDPDGLQVGGLQCPKGTWTIDMSSKSKFGTHHLTVDYLHYTGTLELKVVR